MPNLAIECCETKVQLEYILNTWLSVWNNLSSCLLHVTVLFLLLVNVKTELETWVARSSCPFASLPQTGGQRSVCCCPSPAAAASLHGCRGNPSAASLVRSHQLHDDPAVLHRELVPVLVNCFSVSFYLKIKVCCAQRITWRLLLLPAVLAHRWKQTEWLEGGVLMLLAGSVGDARLIMPMLGFTGVCWDLFSHFMNPG